MYQIFLSEGKDPVLVDKKYSRTEAVARLNELILNQEEGQFYFMLEPAPLLPVQSF